MHNQLIGGTWYAVLNVGRKLLLETGVDKAEVMPSKGNPMVYAENG